MFLVELIYSLGRRFALAFRLGHLQGEPVHLLLEQVERQRSGVVRLEDGPALAGQRCQPRCRPPLITRGLVAFAA